MMADELKACRACGAECRIETFGGGVHCAPWDGYVCSNAKLFGGGCPDEKVYIFASDWNERPNTRPLTGGVTEEAGVALAKYVAAVGKHGGDSAKDGCQLCAAVDHFLAMSNASRGG